MMDTKKNILILNQYACHFAQNQNKMKNRSM